MGLGDRIRNWIDPPEFDGPSADVAAHYSPPALSAAATSAKPGQHDADAAPAEPDWQAQAWAYYRTCGEARRAVDWIAGAISRCHLFIGQDEEDGSGDPKPADNPGAAEEVLAELRDSAMGESAMLKRLAQHLLITGESWLIGYPTPKGAITEADTSWTVCSRQEWALDEGAGTLQLRLADHPQLDSDGWVTFPARQVVTVRVHDPDPADGLRATSPFEAALAALDELDGLDARVQADIQSRLAGAGLVEIPESATMPNPAQSESRGVNPLNPNPLVDGVMHAAKTAIQKPRSPEAVVPIFYTTSDEAAGKTRHISFQTAFDAQIPTLRSDARSRVATVLNIPSEILTGEASQNHWCTVDDVEILSKDGWKAHAQLEVGEEVLTLNHDTGQSEWQPLLAVNRWQVEDEPMVRIDGKRHHSVSTANHRWPVMHGFPSKGAVERRWMTSAELRDSATTAYADTSTVNYRRQRVDELRGQGWKNADIARDLGISAGTVTSYVNNPKRGTRTARLRSNGSTSDAIPLAAPNADLPEEPKFSDALVEIIGWFFTEGSATERAGRRTPQVSIVQSEHVNPQHCASIERALTRLFGPESEAFDKGGRYASPESVARHQRAKELSSQGWKPPRIAEDLGVSAVQARKYLKHEPKTADQVPRWRATYDRNANLKVFSLNQAAGAVILEHAPDRVVTLDFVRALTASQLELFIRSSVLGDGNIRPSGLETFSQKTPERLDALELAAILSGRSVYRYSQTGMGITATGPGEKTQHCLSFSANPLRTSYAPRSSSFSEETYTGTIWCPTTPNGTWFARHEGSSFFTGNSRWMTDSTTAKAYIGPLLTLICDRLTRKVLWPALKSAGQSTSELRKLSIWWDATEIILRPDRSTEALTAQKQGFISNEAARRELGFSEDDAPTESEQPAPQQQGEADTSESGDQQQHPQDGSGGQHAPGNRPEPPQGDGKGQTGPQPPKP